MSTLFYDQLLIVRILAAVVMWSPLAWMFWCEVKERQRARLQAIRGARDREASDYLFEFDSEGVRDGFDH